MPETTTATFQSLGVPDAIVKSLEKDGITTPFPIQAKALPAALAGRDLFGQAQTGSGKTLAFAIPLIAAAGERAPGPFGLVMVPTRELCAKVADEFRKIGGDVMVMSAFGGTAVKKDLARLERGIDILVATPGRL